MSRYPIPWVVAVVVNGEGQVGLVSADGGWDLPQGALEGGQSWRDAVRGCLARAGLTALGERCLGVFGTEAGPEGGRLYAGFLVEDFMGTLGSGRWFSPDELPLGPETRKRVKEWLESPR